MGTKGLVFEPLALFSLRHKGSEGWRYLRSADAKRRGKGERSSCGYLILYIQQKHTDPREEGVRVGRRSVHKHTLEKHTSMSKLGPSSRVTKEISQILPFLDPNTEFFSPRSLGSQVPCEFYFTIQPGMELCLRKRRRAPGGSPGGHSRMANRPLFRKSCSKPELKLSPLLLGPINSGSVRV